MTDQFATLPPEIRHGDEKPILNARNMDGDRERIATLTLVGLLAGKPDQLAQARFWRARNGNGSGPVYCSIWVGHGRCSGHGKASGYGYHRPSAALQAALDSAGIRLAAAIDGVGEQAMEEALIAVGVAMGHRRGELVVLS